jgi:surface antigen
LSPGCAGALRLGRKFKRTKTPQVGDLMFFATDNEGAGHIGIVVARIDDDLVLCIEGNSANSIRYVVRYASEVKFASVSDEILPLPDVELDEAWPIVHVSKKGTR